MQTAPSGKSNFFDAGLFVLPANKDVNLHEAKQIGANVVDSVYIVNLIVNALAQ